MSKTTQLIKNVRANLTDAEIHRLFIKRLDEEMFAQIGASSLTIPQQRQIQKDEMPHLLAWKGYELLRGIHLNITQNG